MTATLRPDERRSPSTPTPDHTRAAIAPSSTLTPRRATMSKCTEQVFKYLAQANRPYSANDVTQNLLNEHSKAQVTKALEQLAQDGRVMEKENGKQKVYCALQGGDGDAASKEDVARELAELDASIASVTANLRAVEQQVRESDATLRKLTEGPTTEEAAAEVAAMEVRVQRLRSKLADLTDNCLKVSPEDRRRVAREHETMMREYRKRKRLCNDILEKIMEGYKGKKAELLEEAGVETDEEAGVKL